MLEKLDLCDLHDQTLALWYASRPERVDAGDDLESLVVAQHFCNFSLWELEDQARRTDVADGFIARTKHSIDSWNQRRNDLIERIDEALLRQLPEADPAKAEQHSETGGQMVDRLSILSLKIWHMKAYAAGANAALAAECTVKREVLETQRRDLARCLVRLLEDFAAGRRYFKIYRQFKAYNDPRLNPVLSGRR